MRVLFAIGGMCLGVASPGLALAEPPSYYIGAGVRTGFNDDFAAVLDSKVKLTSLGEVLSVSLRPELLLGDDVELRLPISLEAEVETGLYPFAGAGVAYNPDGSRDVAPMLTAGLDLGFNSALVLSTELNVIFNSGNTDAEFIGSLNYAF